MAIIGSNNNYNNYPTLNNQNVNRSASAGKTDDVKISADTNSSASAPSAGSQQPTTEVSPLVVNNNFFTTYNKLDITTEVTKHASRDIAKEYKIDSSVIDSTELKDLYENGGTRKTSTMRHRAGALTQITSTLNMDLTIISGTVLDNLTSQLVDDCDTELLKKILSETHSEVLKYFVDNRITMSSDKVSPEQLGFGSEYGLVFTKEKGLLSSSRGSYSYNVKMLVDKFIKTFNQKIENKSSVINANYAEKEAAKWDDLDNALQGGNSTTTASGVKADGASSTVGATGSAGTGKTENTTDVKADATSSASGATLDIQGPEFSTGGILPRRDEGTIDVRYAPLTPSTVSKNLEILVQPKYLDIINSIAGKNLTAEGLKEYSEMIDVIADKLGDDVSPEKLAYTVGTCISLGVDEAIKSVNQTFELNINTYQDAVLKFLANCDEISYDSLEKYLKQANFSDKQISGVKVFLQITLTALSDGEFTEQEINELLSKPQTNAGLTPRVQARTISTFSAGSSRTSSAASLEDRFKNLCKKVKNDYLSPLVDKLGDKIKTAPIDYVKSLEDDKFVQGATILGAMTGTGIGASVLAFTLESVGEVLKDVFWKKETLDLMKETKDFAIETAEATAEVIQDYIKETTTRMFHATGKALSSISSNSYYAALVLVCDYVPITGVPEAASVIDFGITMAAANYDYNYNKEEYGRDFALKPFINMTDEEAADLRYAFDAITSFATFIPGVSTGFIKTALKNPAVAKRVAATMELFKDEMMALVKGDKVFDEFSEIVMKKGWKEGMMWLGSKAAGMASFVNTILMNLQHQGDEVDDNPEHEDDDSDEPDKPDETPSGSTTETPPTTPPNKVPSKKPDTTTKKEPETPPQGNTEQEQPEKGTEPNPTLDTPPQPDFGGDTSTPSNPFEPPYNDPQNNGNGNTNTDSNPANNNKSNNNGNSTGTSLPDLGDDGIPKTEPKDDIDFNPKKPFSGSFSNNPDITGVSPDTEVVYTPETGMYTKDKPYNDEQRNNIAKYVKNALEQKYGDEYIYDVKVDANGNVTFEATPKAASNNTNLADKANTGSGNSDNKADGASDSKTDGTGAKNTVTLANGETISQEEYESAYFPGVGINAYDYMGKNGRIDTDSLISDWSKSQNGKVYTCNDPTSINNISNAINAAMRTGDWNKFWSNLDSLTGVNNTTNNTTNNTNWDNDDNNDGTLESIYAGKLLKGGHDARWAAGMCEQLVRRKAARKSIPFEVTQCIGAALERFSNLYTLGESETLALIKMELDGLSFIGKGEYSDLIDTSNASIQAIAQNLVTYCMRI